MTGLREERVYANICALRGYKLTEIMTEMALKITKQNTTLISNSRIKVVCVQALSRGSGTLGGCGQSITPPRESLHTG